MEPRPQAVPRRPVWSRHRVVAIAAGGATVGAALVLYAATAARDIAYGDSPELTAVALTLGVAHPPGYPVFTVLGWLFGHIPAGPLPFRVALLSVLCHAATVGVVYAGTLRWVRSVPAAVVAAAALASDPLFWHASLVPEVFPLNDLLAAILLLLAAVWCERPERRWPLVAAGLVGGLGLADQQTIALLAPAVLWALWRRHDVLLSDAQVALYAAGAFALGLTPYLGLLLVAARHPVWSWGDIHSFGDLVALVLRQSYGTGSLVGATFQGGAPIDRLTALLAAFDPLQGVLLLVGAAYAWRVNRWPLVYLAIAFLFAGPAFAVYSNADLKDETTRAVLERFFLMPQVAVAPIAGFAVLALADLGRTFGRRLLIEGAGVAVALAATLLLVGVSYPSVDESREHAARTFAMDLLDTLEPGSVFLAGGDAVIYPIRYLQTVEGIRPDVRLLAYPLLTAAWYVREVRREQPDVALPSDRFGPGAATFRSLIDANVARHPIAFIGGFPDRSINGAYWLYPRGLIYDVRRMDDQVPLTTLAADNEAVLARYRPPSERDRGGPFRAWQRATLVDYASAYYRVGRDYETDADAFRASDSTQAGELYATARDWYRRALAVDPQLPEARQRLTRLSE